MLKRAERELKLDDYNCELYSVGTHTNVYGFCIYEHGQGRPNAYLLGFRL